MTTIPKTSLVCGFSKPELTEQCLLLWEDQLFASQYRHYTTCRDHGCSKGLLQSIGTSKYVLYDSFDLVIKIYKIINESIE
ncbi:MAG: hypothetical protein RLP15_11440 [Cryomorphaceae bacterium]